MNVILGKILTGLGLIGILFTIYGRKPIIWVILFVILLLTGSWLIFFKAKKDFQKAQAAIDEEIKKLKSAGQNIKLEFENCEFKESSYTSEVIDERLSRFGQINLDYGKVISNEFVAQSILIYSHKEGDKTELFRQGFGCSKDALKLHVLRNSIDLYVDRSNRTNYLFELKDNGN